MPFADYSRVSVFTRIFWRFQIATFPDTSIRALTSSISNIRQPFDIRKQISFPAARILTFYSSYIWWSIKYHLFIYFFFSLFFKLFYFLFFISSYLIICHPLLMHFATLIYRVIILPLHALFDTMRTRGYRTPCTMQWIHFSSFHYSVCIPAYKGMFCARTLVQTIWIPNDVAKHNVAKVGVRGKASLVILPYLYDDDGRQKPSRRLTQVWLAMPDVHVSQ